MNYLMAVAELYGLFIFGIIMTILFLGAAKK